MEKNEECKDKKKLDKILKEFQEEQMRLHPEIYEKTKNGGK